MSIAITSLAAYKCIYDLTASAAFYLLLDLQVSVSAVNQSSSRYLGKYVCTLRALLRAVSCVKHDPSSCMKCPNKFMLLYQPHYACIHLKGMLLMKSGLFISRK